MRTLAAVPALCLLASLAHASVCPFDCNFDGAVDAGEIRQAVAALFGREEADACAGTVQAEAVRVTHLQRAVAVAGLQRPLCAEGVEAHWVPMPPLPAGPRQEVGVASVGGEIYVVGGITSTAVGVRLVEAFEPTTRRWRRKADLPIPLHHVAVAATERFLYAVGGFAAPGFRPVADVFRYDPETDTWTSLPPLPQAVGAAAAAVVAGKLHVLGGSGASGSVAAHRVYDLATGSWSAAAGLPEAVNHLAAVVWKETLWIVGGRRDGSGLSNSAGLYRYDAVEDRWLPGPTLPTARSGHAAAVVGDWLVVFGGEVNPLQPPTFVYPHVEAFHFASGQWVSDVAMPVPRHGFGAATLGNRVYLPGGAVRAGLGETAWHDAWEIRAAEIVPSASARPR